MLGSYDDKYDISYIKSGNAMNFPKEGWKKSWQKSWKFIKRVKLPKGVFFIQSCLNIDDPFKIPEQFQQ